MALDLRPRSRIAFGGGPVAAAYLSSENPPFLDNVVFHSILAQFELVCENSWKGALVVTLYMIGMGLASFSGYFSDKYTHKNI